jgi:hypothetical protein
MPSEVGERAAGAGFMQFYSALSERALLQINQAPGAQCW